MLRASARHNYSPDSPGDVSAVMESAIPYRIMAGSQRNHRRKRPNEPETEGFAPSGARVASRPCLPRTGDPGVHPALTPGAPHPGPAGPDTAAAIRGHGAAQPPPLRDAPRAALLTRISLV